ncbi:hypothetical protein DSL64_27175 [Dyadobacter luteus]|uniref:Uncharacterized protein n=1 Tax=Dyadobacter luteus TaxID=2259619 RepID=A0A3D8Y2V1_9BACT|nr:hypothetical protein [Dyadobacter luteus]REA56110.1 hypothetical protein DSL64_27175 [Dyadobacter luteus]
MLYLTISPVVAANNYNVRSDKQTLGVSYLGEMGYKWISVFMVYYPDYISLKSSTWSGKGDKPGAGFIEGKRDRIGYISFGVKLDR